MKIRWTRAALADLVGIRRHIAEHNPDAAARVAGRLREAAERLAEHPASGRPGRIPETRELVVAGTPYLLPYRVRGGAVQILRVLHGTREWPDTL